MTVDVARRALANLLRMAATALDDAGLLHECGRATPTILRLAHAAWADLAACVRVSEHGWPLAPGEAIPDENPLAARLLAASPPALPAAADTLGADGHAPSAPDLAAADAWLGGLSDLLQDLAAQFEVTLSGDQPAGNALPLRPPAPAAAPEPSLPRPSAPSWSPKASATVTAATFWSLMDRWGVADLQALQLLGHPGGLTKAGARPRFALRGETAQTMAQLVELDVAITALGVTVGSWLGKRIESAPFAGETPLHFMLAHGRDGIRQANRFILQQSLRSSMQG